MGKLRSTARIADKLLGILTGLMALVLLGYSCYVLYDNFAKGQAAFVSKELLRYKPTVNAEGVYDFSQLRKINKDVRGWLSVYDTNINYPVVQGRDDMEYINKDVYGKSSLTGSIYLSFVNNSELKDMYNIVFGHHMENGSLFGDVARFTDKRFFDTHRDGEFLTPDQAYHLRVFACMETNAYESRVYSVTGINKSAINQMVEYIKANSLYYDRPEDVSPEKIVALSTCSDIRTNGRVVIFCDATPQPASEPVVPAAADITDDGAVRPSEGHGTIRSGWAVMNLICVFVLLYTLFPIGSIRRKYRQLSYSRSKSRELREQSGNTSPNPDEAQEISRDLSRFERKIIIGMVLEILILLSGTVFFLLTEDIHGVIKFSDSFTLPMILLTVLSLAVDFILFRYRGRKPAVTHEN